MGAECACPIHYGSMPVAASGSVSISSIMSISSILCSMEYDR